MYILYLFLLFILGSCLCSFVCLLGMRMPCKRSIISPRSTCDHCNCSLKWFELIPIWGFVLNLGRCRHCRSVIPWYLPANELLLGLSFTYLVLMKEDMFFKILLLLILFFFSTTDYFYGIILPILLIPSFICLIFFQPNIYFLNFVLVLFCLSAFSFFSSGLGYGDVEILSLLAFFIPLYNFLLILLVASSICLLIEISKQNFDKSIRFIPYIYLATTIVFVWK